MFSYLKGTLISSTPAQAIIEVQGIGYMVMIPCTAFGKLPQLGCDLQLFTSFVVREFSHSLYGFLSIDERDLFELLLNITGVGPKLAISIIGHLTPSDLHAAIVGQNLPLLCKVPGVGKKTAERLLIELRDKLQHFAAAAPVPTGIQMPPQTTGAIQDAMMALIGLGYNQAAAKKAITQSLKELPDGVDLATLITTALKRV